MEAQRISTSRRGRVLVTATVLLLSLALAACSNATDATATGTGGGGDGGGGAAPIAAPGGTGYAGPNSSPGVSASEVHFAAIGTESNNPTGQCVLSCFDAGVKAYFAWRNDHDGGVFGRKLVLDKELDDELGFNKDKALQVISANDDFAVFNSPVYPAGFADLAAARIPQYTWALNFPQMNGHDDIYGDRAVICTLCSSRFFTYVATVAHAKKIAALGYGIAQPSKDCVASIDASVKKYADRTGQSMAYVNDHLDYGLPNGIGPEVSAMKDAGVDFVETCFDLNGVKSLEQEMRRQGMDAVPVLHNDSYNAAFVKEAGDLFEGDIVQTSFRPFEANPAGSELDAFKQYMDKTGQQLSEPAMEGWINADLAYAGIKAAGPSFTRESVIAATNQMKSFNAGGLIAPIDWSRQHTMWTEGDPVTHGYDPECRAFVRVHNGAFELIGDPDKPFVCFDPRKPDELDPTATNFTQ
jgi:hypothetical protein